MGRYNNIINTLSDRIRNNLVFKEIILLNHLTQNNIMALKTLTFGEAMQKKAQLF